MKLHAGLIAACVIALALPAVAADRKAYHGADCKLFSGAYSYSEITGVQAYNVNSSFVCPLIRDRLEATTSLNDVYVEGYNAGGSYSCRLYAQTEDGSSGSYVEYDDDASSTTGRVQLHLNVASTGPGTSGNEGSYAVKCDLTTGSYIYHIQVVEDDTAAE